MLGSVQRVVGLRPRLAHSPLCTLQILALRQARRPVPPEVAQQYQDVVQRSQWQRAQLEQGGAALRREYASHLERQLHFYTEAARRLGYDGSREAAKEALYRRNLVESELQRLRR